MSIRVVRAVFERSRATGANLLVLLDLAERASDDGVAWPSQEEIGRRTKARNVSRCVGELVTLGEVEVRTYRVGRERHRVYRVVVSGVAAEVDYVRLERRGIRVDEPFTSRVISSRDDITARHIVRYERSCRGSASPYSVEPPLEPSTETEPARRSRDRAGAPRNGRTGQDVRASIRDLVAELDDADNDTEDVFVHTFADVLTAADVDAVLVALLDRRDLPDVRERYGDYDVQPIDSEAAWTYSMLQRRTEQTP